MIEFHKRINWTVCWWRILICLPTSIIGLSKENHKFLKVKPIDINRPGFNQYNHPFTNQKNQCTLFVWNLESGYSTLCFPFWRNPLVSAATFLMDKLLSKVSLVLAGDLSFFLSQICHVYNWLGKLNWLRRTTIFSIHPQALAYVHVHVIHNFISQWHWSLQMIWTSKSV